jgi:signal transduction histidine kinase
MASDRAWASPLVLRLATGAAGAGLLTWLLVELLVHTNFYATALIVAVALMLVIYSLGKAIDRADGAMADALDNLATAPTDSALRPMSGLPALTHAFEAASARLRHESRQRQAERDSLKGLLDTVPSALLVLQADGQVELVNRAAFALAGGDVRRLEDIPALGVEAAKAIATLPPGGRAVIKSEGGKLFASASRMSRPGEPPVSLIALQGVAEDLGAVEQQAWGNLIRVLAHEMMNSLTPIVSLSESLAQRPMAGTDPEAKAALQVIARRSENLMTFVDRYRAVSQLPRPVLQLTKLEALASDVARLMDGSLAEAGARFEIEIEPVDLQISADPGLLEQAIINLLKNALDATADRSSPSIVLTCRTIGGVVLIGVADNGEGVPPDKTESIFVPFFTSRTGGSGIGLSLARQIAVAHGGQLTVRANSPCGSVFELSLPC